MMVHGDRTVQHQSMGPTLFITLMVFGIMVVLPTQFSYFFGTSIQLRKFDHDRTLISRALEMV